MKKVLVILGPTATGKTDVALNLAKKLNGELVSSDSRQVYKGLDIGTGKKPSNKSLESRVKKKEGFWEINGIKIWMYDVLDPREQFTVKDYVEQASEIVEDILKIGKLPIIVGGTGFYIKALLEGLPNLAIPIDKKLRGELGKLSLEKLQNKLKLLSPTKWNKLNDSDKKNPRRLLRSIELILMNPYMKTKDCSNSLMDKYQILKIGLTAPRELLNERINLRLISRINQGLIKEGENLLKKGLPLQRMRELGLEYGVLADLLQNKINKKEFAEILENKIHQFAKRQMTWYKKEKNIFWFDITLKNWEKKMEKLVARWYYSSND
ncbi:MAG: tRNA (adenosine(37)-N6)-dimethylallyltransferase MiaA [Candidatus Daviesbacteria bacterium]